MTERPKVVAVVNTSPDTVDLLRFVFEHAGYTVVSAFTWEIRDAAVDPEAFMRQHSPDVVVYDIAPPYEENWRLFQHFRAMPVNEGRKFVITTTHAKHVRAIAGEGPVLHEILGKPYDLDLVVKAVEKAIGPADESSDEGSWPGSTSSSSPPS
jgi:DNA-binding NtrC family response regulator